MNPPNPNSVGVVIFDHLGRVLLVHQSYGAKKWSLPGGQIEEGESPWIAAIRECKEEINLNIELKYVSLSGIYFLAHRNAYHFVFKVKEWSEYPIPDGIEIDQVDFFHIHQLPSPMSNFTVQRIKDAFSSHVILKEQHIKDYIVGDPKEFV